MSPGGPSKLVKLPVELLVADEEGRLGAPHHGLALQLVLLCAVTLHVEGLFLHHAMRALGLSGRASSLSVPSTSVGNSSMQMPMAKGAQQRVDVYRLRPRQRLPHPRRDVEQRAEAGKPLSDVEHVLAERHHLVVQTLPAQCGGW